MDATALFAAVIGKGKANDLFFEGRLKLVALPYLISEFEKNIGTIAKICGISESEVKEEFVMLKQRLEIFPIYIFPVGIQSKAEKLAPHANDVPYFALALYLNCGIWSRERDFKKQPEVGVFNTKDLLKELGLG